MISNIGMANAIRAVKPLPHPWTPAQATDRIRAMARNEAFTLSYKIMHTRKQLEERSLFISDILYILRNGFVFTDPIEATRRGFYRYAMECRTPNSGQRDVRVIVIPALNECEGKIVTIMWADEPIVGG